MNETDLAWFAARLSIAVYDTNREYLMGHVADLRESLRDIPGGRSLTMRYEDGGATQVFQIGEDELPFPGSQSVSASDIRSELDKKKD